MEYRVSKASTDSIITAFTCHQLSIDIFFSLLSMKYDTKIQNAAILRFLRYKILHSKSRTQCFWEGRIFFFLGLFLSKRYTKVPEVVFAISLLRLPKKVYNPAGTTPYARARTPPPHTHTHSAQQCHCVSSFCMEK